MDCVWIVLQYINYCTHHIKHFQSEQQQITYDQQIKKQSQENLYFMNNRYNVYFIS